MRRLGLLFSVVLFVAFHVLPLHSQESNGGVLSCAQSVILPVALPGMTSEKVVEIVCESDTPVTVYGIEQHGAFEVTSSLESIEFPVVLQRGEVLSFVLSYTPLGMESSSYGILVVESDADVAVQEIYIEAHIQVISVDEQHTKRDFSVDRVQHAGGMIAMQVEAEHAESVTVLIVDVLGNVLARSEVVLQSGVNDITIAVREPSGMAFIDVIGREERHTKAMYFE